MKMAGGEGFEPSLSEPESDVLPLDDPPTCKKLKGRFLPESRNQPDLDAVLLAA